VPSNKRARQRAAREQKQAIIDKGRKRRRSYRRGAVVVVAAAAIVGIVLLVNGSTPKSAGKKTTQTTLGSATSTTTSSTTTTFATPTTQALSSAAVEPTCPSASGSTKRVTWFKTMPPDCISKTSVWLATFDTSLGNIVVKMNAVSSYAAVNNFVFLARYKYYDGIFFQRIVSGFVVQGGDPTGTGSGGVHSLPGYHFTGNEPPSSCKSDPSQSACYQVGDLALANAATASSDASQFFFVLPGGQTVLNQEPVYTIFGKVTSGLSVVEKIGAYGSEAGTPKLKIYILSLTVKQIAA
jgi:cyclophilin family peptidyl-prolyl cis-trans isomerase